MLDGRSGIPPSEGERRALVGFSPQYRLAALLALRALERGLEAVRLLDPDAGRVDDIQLYKSNRIDAYQVKWEQYPRCGDLQSSCYRSGWDAKPRGAACGRMAEAARFTSHVSYRRPLVNQQ